MIYHRRLEMRISREEFLRLLPAAVGSFELERDGETVHGAAGGRRWTIRLIPLAGQRLGRIGLPRHQVEITIDDCPEPEGETFMRRFRRGFLRGGG